MEYFSFLPLYLKEDIFPFYRHNEQDTRRVYPAGISLRVQFKSERWAGETQCGPTSCYRADLTKRSTQLAGERYLAINRWCRRRKDWL